MATALTKEPKRVGIVLPEMDIRTIEITLVGISPLIVHRFGAKQKKEIADKEQQKATSGREAKVPEQEYEDSKYIINGVECFPAIAFKSAAVSACTSLGKSITKVAARQSHHVLGDYVPIVGESRMREDIPRVRNGAPTIRYRAEYPNWEVVLKILYNARVLSAEQLVNLYNTAGFSVGVGEWRPEKDGQNGMFEVKRGN